MTFEVYIDLGKNPGSPTSGSREEMIHLGLWIWCETPFLLHVIEGIMMMTLLSTADLFFLQYCKNEFNTVACSTFLSFVLNFSFVFCLIWDAIYDWRMRVG